MNHLISLAEILAVPLPAPRLGLDRSTRRVDADGHMHIETSVLSSAGVSGYRACEIPDADKLGLDPNRIYPLLRPADELAKAAAGFSGKPVLNLHRRVSATDHAHLLTVGAVGSPVSFDGRDLVGPLVIWDGEAIAGIESGEQRALSCGYQYRADMSPGIHNGVRYDGRMVDLVANHVALCDRGRVPNAIVGDAAIDKGLSTMNDPTPLQLFLARKLSGSDLDQANQLLEELLQDPSAQIAEDGRRRAAQAVMRSTAKLDAKYAGQFPGLSKLKHRAY